MTEQELRALIAATILGGRYADDDRPRLDEMIYGAIVTTDTLLEGLKDLTPLKKRIEEWKKQREQSGVSRYKPQTGRYPKDRYPPQEPEPQAAKAIPDGALF